MGTGNSSQIDNKNNAVKKFREPTKQLKLNKQSYVKKQIQQPLTYNNQLHLEQDLDYNQLCKNMPLQVKTQIQKLKKQTISQSKNIIIDKILKNEIRPIFVQQKFEQSKFKDIKKLEEYLFIDLAAYQLILSKRIQNYICNNYKKNVQTKQENQIYQQITQLMLCSKQITRQIIGQLMGKTSIWRSLMISNQQQRQKIINFLLEEGIEKSKIAQIQIINTPNRQK